VLGQPENTHVVNFASLGFGGSIILELGYVVFDKPGNDIQIVETSFGNPSCKSYPEKASVELSLDKSNWVTLGATLCQDGTLDLGTAGMRAAQYLRVTDRTLASKFNGTADGYDIDGVVVLQPGCEFTPATRPEIQGDKSKHALLTLLQGSNPDEYIITGSDEVLSSARSFKVINLAGQLLAEGNILQTAEENAFPAIHLKGLSSGIYFVTIESENYNETIKLLKN
jgi:hypothetical protein